MKNNVGDIQERVEAHDGIEVSAIGVDNATAAAQKKKVRESAGEMESLEREWEISTTLLMVSVLPAAHAHDNVVVGSLETEVLLEQSLGQEVGGENAGVRADPNQVGATT